MSNLIKRTVPVILVLALCLTCLVSPVSASSVDDHQLIEALDYYTGDTYFFPNSTSFFFDIEKPSTSSIYYMELLIRTDYEDLSVNFCSSANPMTIYKVTDKVYRCVWSGVYAQSLFRFLLYGSNSATFVNVLSARYSCYPLTGDELDCGYSFSDGYSTSSGTHLIGSDPTRFSAYSSDDLLGDLNYYIYVYPHSWQAYDYLTVYLNLLVESISSVVVLCGDQVIYPEVSYYNPTTNEDVFVLSTITIDLSAVDRSNSSLALYINGCYYPSSNTDFLGRLVSCHGYFYTNTDDTSISWIKRFFNTITSNHDSLMIKLDEIFGVNDDSASAAQQTQEEINVSVNNQLVGAVEDWNSNIEVVQTGYDSALTKATPALGWLASLADRIFTNMGWFGNIYFLIGLISVIMLVLSKSGLARSVGRIRRSD